MSGTEKQKINDPARSWEECASRKQRKTADRQSQCRVTEVCAAEGKNQGVHKGIVGGNAAYRPS